MEMPKKKTRADLGYKKPEPPKKSTPPAKKSSSSFDRSDRTRKHDTPVKKATGHDPARKKTGATKTTHGSTYDFRKKPVNPKADPRRKTNSSDRRAQRARDRAIRNAARKKAAAERKAAATKKRAERKKKRLLDR